MDQLNQLMRRPGFWTTMAIAALGILMMSLGHPMRLPLKYAPLANGLAVYYVTASTIFIVGLGFWAALRSVTFSDRMPVPLLLTACIALSELAGQRLNYFRELSLSIFISQVVIFATTFVVFSLFRRFGWWRIGSPQEYPPQRVAISRLFLWVSVAAMLMAIFGGLTRGQTIDFNTTQIAMEASVAIGLGVMLSLLVIPSIGLVIGKSRMPYVIAVCVVSVVATAATIAIRSKVGGGGAPDAVFLVLAVAIVILIPVWMAVAYRADGFFIVGADNEGPRTPWLTVGRYLGVAVLSIVTFSSILICTAHRAEAKFLASWAESGVHVDHHEGGQLQFVTFASYTFPITRDAVNALKSDTIPIICVRQLNPTPEEVSWLAEIQSARTLYLDGKAITDQHLDQLRSATHLKEIYLSGTSVTNAGLATMGARVLNTNFNQKGLRAVNLVVSFNTPAMADSQQPIAESQQP